MATATQSDQRLQQLKQKYASVLNMMQQSGVRLEHVHIANDKLYIKGTAPSQDVKNRIWDQIKLVDPGYSDLTAEIDAPAGAEQSRARSGGAGQTYTVQAGDTLSKIAKQFYGDSNQYMKIFNANKDKLNDPNMIHPGQQLTIPQ
ncbi:MAG TPA: LysM peptidoglycan-binding domain-containing protein [Bryobacteraceae bacterium]|nr:LysM peptidoglycan-binding domain-containing protein [Bryobacteraceae bacterium]